jgi:hypothetical protein
MTKRIKQLAASLLILLQAGPALAGNDSIPVLQRIEAKQALINNFFSLPFVNPALKPFQFPYQTTEIRIETQHEQETEAIVPQEGDGQRFALLDVDSYIPLPNSALWGNASYANGKRFNLKLNETSDPDVLYPYLTGDTIGGNIRSEIYRFGGGYAQHGDRFSWGLQAAFRAAQEYRAVDPRPENIASDLRFALGGGFRIVPAYTAALAVYLRKYKQKNEIEFYNELGDVKVYHYTGLGTDYARFRTKADKSYYNGSAAGASVQLLPLRPSGFTAALKYNRFHFEKVISSLNELNMLDLTEHDLEAEAGYRKTTALHTFAFRLDARIARKKGSENIFGDESSNNYPFLLSIEQYRRETARLATAALYEQADRHLQWAIQPVAGYEADAENYALPRREISRSHFTSALNLTLAGKREKLSFRTAAAVKQYFPITSVLSLTANEQENFSIPALVRNHEFLAGKRTTLSIDGRINYALRQRYALFLSIHWQRGKYIYNTTTDYIAASAGITF